MSSGGFYEGGYAGYGGGGNSSTGGYSGGGSDAYGNGGMGQSTQPLVGQSAPGGVGTSQSSQQTPATSHLGSAGGMMGGNIGDTPAFWNPAVAASVMGAAASGNTDAMMGVAESMGKQFLETGWARAVPGLEKSMVTLRVYFAVDNNYVKKKMGRILMPFLFKSWKRVECEPTGADPGVSYALPHSDTNAPDLYIPAMSLITYVLLCALCYGTAGKFDPDVLPDVTSKCFICQVLEVMLIRFGFYLMDAPVSILDLFSYTGYKYLGLSMNMFIGLTLGHFVGYGHRAYYISFLWTASAIAYFILKVMANNIPRITSATGPKREFMVLGMAASQIATCWFVSQTKFLE